MKKGFTLVELLIVIVIVSVLATVALPKYRASLERGRSLEAISNLKAVSDYINTRYEIDGTYPNSIEDDSGESLAGITRNTRFSKPDLKKSTTPMCGTYASTGGEIQIVNSRGYYTLAACNKDGELTRMVCKPNTPKGSKEDCENIGMICNESGCHDDFFLQTGLEGDSGSSSGGSSGASY